MDLTPNWITVDTMIHRREEACTKWYSVVGPLERREAPEEIRAYWSFRDEISV